MNMKLLDLFEGKYVKLNNEDFVGNVHIVKGSSDDMFTVYIDVEYNDIVPNTNELQNSITQILEYTVEQIKKEFKTEDGVIFIGEVLIKDRLEGGGSVILIGRNTKYLELKVEILL